MKLHQLSSAALLLATAPLGAYSQSFTDMVDTAKIKFFNMNRGGDAVYLRGQKDSNKNNTPSTNFSTELFLEVSDSTKSGDNFLISPLSVYNALELVKEGATAGSETQSQLQKVLGSPPHISDTDDKEYGVTLSTASSIWADNLKQTYVKSMKSEHSSQAFRLPPTYTPVNKWIEKETKGLIKDFIQPVSPGPGGPTLVSTVYFKGNWSQTFDPDQTIDEEFTLRDGSKKKGRFMTDIRSAKVLDKESKLGEASAMLLPYGNDGAESDYASLFILPADDSVESMESVLEGLNSHPFHHLGLKGDRVDIKLPRFKIDYSDTLKEELQNMGIKAAFNASINNKFDIMSNDSALTVGDVIHGASMSVTEKGTEAGAVTVVHMFGSSRMEKPPLDMNFNRPFITAIVHIPTGEYLFIGRVESPDLIMKDPDVHNS